MNRKTAKGVKEKVGAGDMVKRLTDYFYWRQPYRGDEARTIEAVTWALEKAQQDPESLAVYILEVVNERNSLARRMGAVGVIATNQDFIEDATIESVEWAFGKKLKSE